MLIAPSFADIFHQNCLKNGVLPITLSEEKISYLFKQTSTQPYELTVSLENKSIHDERGFKADFDIHPYWYNMLLNGWDEIELTLQLEDSIQAYERKYSYS